MKTLKYFFLITDIGFIIYWLITLLGLIPDEYLYQDYTNQLLVAWNWSFFWLDIFVSITGILSLYLWKKQNSSWEKIALISLVLTFCSGLQAISFWIIRKDFDITWWLPNLFLMIYPLFFIYKILKTK
ncbi:hypothetical protein EMA8858_00263 [Emticicia aquatica]|uniref:YvaD family protein n=1 Tax=Emticicia aquatica TaxID=1681835 RepID=A0ABM9AKC9_9BACT|nr:DUF5360 family protein [Emticicia aquatica]CAH0994156.1 hypothetical protein EMA8858_00263 [Emticicia aquatica]